jgi:hypothetical protein
MQEVEVVVNQEHQDLQEQAEQAVVVLEENIQVV